MAKPKIKSDKLKAKVEPNAPIKSSLAKPKKKIEKRETKKTPKVPTKIEKSQPSQEVVQSQQTEQSSEIKRIRKFQKTLVFGSRGMTELYRHTMLDMRTLLPHSKRDMKFDSKDDLKVINEICSEKNCENCMFFEVRKKQDCYLHLAKYPNGPTVKFLLQNVHTMKELKMTGNCLKGSRPLLSFDANFDTLPHWKVMKQLFIDSFGTGKGHPKSKPFVDHVFYFGIADNRIWFRNYQIVDAPGDNKHSGTQLIEIGPRLVMNPIKILAGSFQGSLLWENPDYLSPSQMRSELKTKYSEKYTKRVEQKKQTQLRAKKHSVKPNPLDNIFVDPNEMAENEEDFVSEEEDE